MLPQLSQAEVRSNRTTHTPAELPVGPLKVANGSGREAAFFAKHLSSMQEKRREQIASREDPEAQSDQPATPSTEELPVPVATPSSTPTHPPGPTRSVATAGAHSRAAAEGSDLQQAGAASLVHGSAAAAPTSPAQLTGAASGASVVTSGAGQVPAADSASGNLAPANTEGASLEGVILDEEMAALSLRESEELGRLGTTASTRATGLSATHAALETEPASVEQSLPPIDKQVLALMVPAEKASVSTTPPQSMNGSVTLERLPQALHARLHESVRFHQEGDRWTAELKLDPPNLGTITVHLELHGDTIRGVLHHHDPAVRTLLEKLLPDLEQQLSSDGHEASLQLANGSNPDEQSSSDRSAQAGQESDASAVAQQRSPRRRAHHRLLDVIA